MKSKHSQYPIARRQFLSTLAVGGLSGGALAQAKAAINPSKFDYHVERFRIVDPALIRYKRTLRFGVPKPEARRLAMGPDQRLYVAAGNSILVLDQRGALLRALDASNSVRSIAVAPDGTIFAGANDHIELFDAQSRRTAVWETPKGQPILTGIALSADEVFVADAGNRIVWRYDRSGRLLRRIGEKDPQRNIPGFAVPSAFFDVKVGHDGLLRVANPGRHRVEIYTPDGDLEFSWGKPGAAIDAFCGCCNPCNLDLLPDGRVVTFEKGLPRVKIFSMKGALECVVAPPGSFADPAQGITAREDCSYGGIDGVVDARGNVFVLDRIGQDIQVFAPSPARPA